MIVPRRIISFLPLFECAAQRPHNGIIPALRVVYRACPRLYAEAQSVGNLFGAGWCVAGFMKTFAVEVM